MVRAYHLILTAYGFWLPNDPRGSWSDMVRAWELLKGDASHRLLADGLHPFADQPYHNGRVPTPSARREWNVFLDCDADIRRAIRYVEDNPLKEGMKRQAWRFVIPYCA